MRALILGRGNMGRAIRTGLEARGDEVVAMLGRPNPGTPRPDPSTLATVDITFEFSHASAAVENVRYALDAGCRSIVLGTTGWADDRARIEALAEASGARIVAAPTYSLGAILFGELAETAARLFGRFSEYDPYLLEWHRRTKPDRPSGTALSLAERVLPHLPSKHQARLADDSGAPDPETLEVVALRAGASPGQHVFGFDAPGETIELRITARDRSAYVAGALLAADWLLSHPVQPAGLIAFESIIQDVLATSVATA